MRGGEADGEVQALWRDIGIKEGAALSLEDSQEQEDSGGESTELLYRGGGRRRRWFKCSGKEKEEARPSRRRTNPTKAKEQAARSRANPLSTLWKQLQLKDTGESSSKVYMQQNVKMYRVKML